MICAIRSSSSSMRRWWPANSDRADVRHRNSAGHVVPRGQGQGTHNRSGQHRLLEDRSKALSQVLVRDHGITGVASAFEHLDPDKDTIVVVGVALAVVQASVQELALLGDPELTVVQGVVPILPEGDRVGALRARNRRALRGLGVHLHIIRLGYRVDVLALGRIDHAIVELRDLLQLAIGRCSVSTCLPP